MTHALYVASAYSVSALTLIGLFGWILLDQRARKREFEEIAARGIRRRSARAEQAQ